MNGSEESSSGLIVEVLIRNEGDELVLCPKKFSSQIEREYEKADSPISHNRTETTLVKDINQSYQFVSALGDFSEKEDSASSQFEFSNESYHVFDSSPSNQRQKHSPSNSESEVTVPDRIYCTACRKYSRTVLRYTAPEQAFWKKILCSLCYNDNTDCIALYCCSTCNLVLTKVKYKFKNPI